MCWGLAPQDGTECRGANNWVRNVDGTLAVESSLGYSRQIFGGSYRNYATPLAPRVTPCRYDNDVSQAACFSTDVLAAPLPPGAAPGSGNTLIFEDQTKSGIAEGGVRVVAGKAFTKEESFSQPVEGSDLFGTGWHVIGGGDLDGDGDSELIWRNDWSHHVAFWLMRGGLFRSFGQDPLGVSPVLANGTFATPLIADVNQDGKADIIWPGDKVPPKPGFPPNDLWSYTRWQIDATSSPAVTVTTGTTRGKIVGVGQFDGTGQLDFVTTLKREFSSLYEVRVVLADGGGTKDLPGAGIDNVLGAVGDFDQDGTSDLVWQDSALNVSAWKVSAGSYVRSEYWGKADAGWTVRGAADMDGDGRSDVVLTHNGTPASPAKSWRVWHIGGQMMLIDRGAQIFTLHRELVGFGKTQTRIGWLFIDTFTYVSANDPNLCPVYTLTVTDSKGLAQTTTIDGPNAYLWPDSGAFKCVSGFGFNGPSDTYTVTSSLGATSMAMLRPDTITTLPFCPKSTGCPIPSKPPVSFTNDRLTLNRGTLADGTVIYSNRFPVFGSVSGVIKSIKTGPTGLNFPFGNNSANCNVPSKVISKGPNMVLDQPTELDKIFGMGAMPRFPIYIVTCSNTANPPIQADVYISGTKD